ncbi:MAG TPA: histidine kinase [Gemmatimonadaceae bacterium]|nr:histidine kinase [Gemmatimonadaceae bacterium]
MENSRRLQPWMLVSLAWLGPAFLGFITSLGEAHIFGEPINVRAAFFYSTDWLLYALLTPGVFFFARRWPIARPHLISRTLIHIALSIIFSALWAGGGTVLKLLLQPNTFQHGVATFAISWFVGTLPFGCAVYLGMVGVEHAIKYFTEARAREVQLVRMSEQLTGARLAALKAQLNPHFLFNALNTITVLMREGDNAGATRVMEQLSDVLRLTLSRNNENEVTLEDELELVRQYLEVERARFSDRLRPEFDIAEDTVYAAVPSFALQHLVENAVRHGIARRSGASRVAIAARRDGDMVEITVTDDGPGIDGAAEPTGHGLANTRERLRTLYGDRAALEVRTAPGGGTIAKLRIPFHEVPTRGGDAGAVA